MFMDDKRIKEILSEMTIEQKALAVTGSSMFKLDGHKYYGIPAAFMIDGGTGSNYYHIFNDLFYRIYGTGEDGWQEMINDASGLSDKMLRFADVVAGISSDFTEDDKEELSVLREKMEERVPKGELPGCFPPGILLGSSWNEENVYAVGHQVAEEADHYGVNILLGTPNVNVHRDPLNGRLFEGYSEDPYLCGKLAPEFVKGVQSQGIAANVKHFVANNQETNRRTVNEHIPERALREIYFKGFQKCVQDGKCKTVMSAYNLVNGTACSMNRWLLTDILRGEWGFEGFVMSDWGGAYNQIRSLNAGNDLDMPGPRKVDIIVKSVEDGTLSEGVLDIAITRIWKTLLSLPCYDKDHKRPEINREKSRQVAYDSVKEGMILLKNDNNTLPLSKDIKVSFFGEKSRKLIESGGGSAQVLTDQTSNIFDATKRLIGDENVSFETADEKTGAIIVTVGSMGQEGFDRTSLDINIADQKALKKSIELSKKFNTKLIVILNVCGPVDLMPFIEDIDAVLCLFIPGMEGGNACADALFGVFSPSGKLPLSYPKRYRDCPTAGNFPGWNNEVWYGEGIFVGYRYYDYKDIEPLFPFGHGLSYTEFAFSNIKLSKDGFERGSGDEIELSITVKNIGAFNGKEVVQVYIGQDNPTMVKPIKELKHFKKVELKSGEEKLIKFTIKEEDLVSYDSAAAEWVSEPDLYHIYVGNSSRNILQTADFRLSGYNPFGFNENTVLGDFAATPGAIETISELCHTNTINRETIEWTILYQPSGSFKDYWFNRLEPMINGTKEEKSEIYKKILKEINKFK